MLDKSIQKNEAALQSQMIFKKECDPNKGDIDSCKGAQTHEEIEEIVPRIGKFERKAMTQQDK